MRDWAASGWWWWEIQQERLGGESLHPYHLRAFIIHSALGDVINNVTAAAAQHASRS